MSENADPRDVETVLALLDSAVEELTGAGWTPAQILARVATQLGVSVSLIDYER